MAERRASLMEPRIEPLMAQGRLEVHARDARRRCGPARSTTTTTSSARGSAGSCRRRSPRCRASRCRSRWKRSRPARSCTSASTRPPTSAAADADGEIAGRRPGRRPGLSRPAASARPTRCPLESSSASRGGIAAYKAVEVCRRLVDAGVHVAPVLTEDAQRFVGALTFSALASEPARTSLFDGPEPIPHTRLGQTADLDRRRARDRQAASASTRPASPTTC